MTKKKIILFLIFNFILINVYPVNASISSKIIANIGNEIITSYELKNKIKIVLFLTDQERTQANVNKAKKNSLNSLINYKLKKQEVKKFLIPIERDVNVERILENPL